MKPIVNAEKCVGCNACVKDCPAQCLTLVDRKATLTGGGCIGCGHCFAACPVAAIALEENGVRYEPEEAKNGENAGENANEYTPLTAIDSELLLRAMKSRRTTRVFENRPVEEEKIAKILEAGRYCQTAQNGQRIAFTILGSRQEEIESACIRAFRKGIGFAKKLVKALAHYELDDHFLFKGASLVIIISGQSPMDRGLAASYMELMAGTLGLGCLISGFTEMAIRFLPGVKKKLQLPKGHKIFDVMIIGYPAVRYYRIPPRNPAKTTVL